MKRIAALVLLFAVAASAEPMRSPDGVIQEPPRVIIEGSMVVENPTPFTLVSRGWKVLTPGEIAAWYEGKAVAASAAQAEADAKASEETAASAEKEKAIAAAAAQAKKAEAAKLEAVEAETGGKKRTTEERLELIEKVLGIKEEQK